MSRTTKITVSVPEELFRQTKTISRQLNISPDRLIEIALEKLLKNDRDQVESKQGPDPELKAATELGPGNGAINQGDIYWVALQNPEDLAPRIPHPQVVIQPDVLNHSRIETVVVCGVTSNLRRANVPGNVLLDAGEANLPRQSIIEVSKVSTLAKSELGEYVGSLPVERINQIFAGMRFLQRSYFGQ